MSTQQKQKAIPAGIDDKDNTNFFTKSTLKVANSKLLWPLSFINSPSSTTAVNLSYFALFIVVVALASFNRFAKGTANSVLIPPASFTQNALHFDIGNSASAFDTCEIKSYEKPGAHTCIIGGATTSKDRYPYAVNLSFKNSVPHCGGSLISKSHILTAAHCVRFGDKTNPPDYIFVGRFDLSDPREIHEVFLPRSVYVHPKFDYLKLANDLAIIEINGASTYEPVLLADSNFIDSLFSVLEAEKSVKLNVFGWGAMSGNPAWSFPSPVLMDAELNLISFRECKTQWTSYFKGSEDFKHINSVDEVISFDEESILCASGNGVRSPCYGDSGGPILIKKEMFRSMKGFEGIQRDIQLGVTSYVPAGCRHEKVPSVYSSSKRSYHWIKSILGDALKPWHAASSVSPAPMKTRPNSGVMIGIVALLGLVIIFLVSPRLYLIRTEDENELVTPSADINLPEEDNTFNTRMRRKFWNAYNGVVTQRDLLGKSSPIKFGSRFLGIGKKNEVPGSFDNVFETVELPSPRDAELEEIREDIELIQAKQEKNRLGL